MKEKHLVNHEYDKGDEITHDKETSLYNHETNKESSNEEKRTEMLEKTRNETEKLYEDDKQDIKEKINQHLDEKDPSKAKSLYTNSYLSRVTASNELRHIQRKLNPIDKLGSHFIHQKGISKVSELTSSTIYRPSGVLGGGILAFVGTLIYYFYAKHTGLSYNYLLALILFVAGFVAGVAIELLFKLFRTKI